MLLYVWYDDTTEGTNKLYIYENNFEEYITE